MAYDYFHQAGAPDKPMIVAFHGTGGDEYQFVNLISQMVPEAGILAPRGNVLEYGAKRFFRRTSEGVYDMDDLVQRTQDMLRFIEDARSKYPHRPFYAFGYSNGANILASMLFERPKLFARAALLHPLIPWVPSTQPNLNGFPVLVCAGLYDPICPLQATKQLIQWLADQGAYVESFIQPGGHEISPAEIQALQAFLTDEVLNHIMF